MRIEEVHAPYGFVPLNEAVFLPDWAAWANQDWPLEQGLCGVIEVEVEAHTPIFVRGGGDAERFARTPEGEVYLPGSSLRGVLRNVVEIASFGWMRRVNDHRYGVRDLYNRRVYVDHVAAIMQTRLGKRAPMPLVVAGWLQKAPDELRKRGIAATIRPCSFAKVEYRLVEQLAKRAGVRNYQPGNRQPAPRKYRAWGVDPAKPDTLRKLDVALSVQRLRPPEPRFLGCDFGLVTGPGTTRGRLVFTGQPSRWDPRRPPRKGGGHPKHHDFFFYGERPSNELRVVDERTFADFEFIHSASGEQHSRNEQRKPNEEWGFWKKAFEQGISVPVFFLPDSPEGRGVRAFGLAMMFRLAYRYSILDAVRNAQPGLFRDPRPDLAETLFGHVPLRQKGRGAEWEPFRKGRVSVGHGRLVAGGRELEKRTEVLGTPKASYYPAYVEQDPARPGARPKNKDSYVTYMDDGVRPRGSKRYRPQPGTIKGPPLPRRADGSVNKDVGTTFRPLEAGTRFRHRIRLHNVLPEELGALLWALDFGGRGGECFHTIGMARSLGYGRCTIRLLGHSLAWNRDGGRLDDADLDEARKAYERAMEGFARAHGVEGGWAGSRRVCELLALARVLPEDSPHRRHMSIARHEGHRKINEFTEAKRNAAVLPPACDDRGWTRGASTGHVSRPVSKRSVRRGEGTGTRAAAGAVSSMPTAPSRRRDWKRLKGGTRVEVELTGKTRKGKWTCKLVDEHAQGRDTRGIMLGDPPADADVGKRYPAVVTAGGNPMDLQLRWA